MAKMAFASKRGYEGFPRKSLSKQMESGNSRSKGKEIDYCFSLVKVKG